MEIHIEKVLHQPNLNFVYLEKHVNVDSKVHKNASNRSIVKNIITQNKFLKSILKNVETQFSMVGSESEAFCGSGCE